MPIVQQGSINTTALVVPDLYVQIVPPQNLVLNGVPTDIVGVGRQRELGAGGPAGDRGDDVGLREHVRPAGGAQIRHGHAGRDGGAAGRAELPLRARDRRHRHRGQADAARAPRSRSPRCTPAAWATRSWSILGSGSQANTWRLTVMLPGLLPESLRQHRRQRRDVLAEPRDRGEHGQGPQRGPSALVTASANGTTAAPAAGTYTVRQRHAGPTAPPA